MRRLQNSNGGNGFLVILMNCHCDSPLVAELCLSTMGSIRLAPNAIVREGEKVLNCIGDSPLLETGGDE